MGRGYSQFDYEQLDFFHELPLLGAKLHCPSCDYYFVNNSLFYKFCPHCGSEYDVLEVYY